jgi:putative Mn2+ efflux pump MntP
LSSASSAPATGRSWRRPDDLGYVHRAATLAAEPFNPTSSLGAMLKLILLVLPLGLDTFAVSASLGMRGVSPRERLRVSLVLSAFELVMPVVGLLLGHALGRQIGNAAEYLAIAVLAAVGVWMLAHEDDEDERFARLSSSHGLVLLALGISISLDELAVGFTIGLLHLSVWLAVGLIGAQAFLFAQLGLRLGTHINESLRERAEQLAGAALLALAVLLAAEKLT